MSEVNISIQASEQQAQVTVDPNPAVNVQVGIPGNGGEGITYNFQESVTETGGVVKLVSDVQEPGLNKLYGTNEFGSKGWYDQPSGGVTDHGGLTGLENDDHTQYAALAGRTSGQTLNGGNASGNDLTLSSTTHATKGRILLGNSAYDEVNNRLGIGTQSPDRSLHTEISGSATNTIAQASRITHTSTATPAVGFGVGNEAELENASGNNVIAGTQTYAWSDPVNGTEDATWTLNLIRAGSMANALTVTSAGALTVANSIVANGNSTVGAANGFFFSGRSAISSPANGNILLVNNGFTDFSLLMFGGTSSTFPALKRSGTTIQARLANDSGYANLAAANIVLNNIQEYADNSAATTAGLTSGMLYRTGDVLKIVH